MSCGQRLAFRLSQVPLLAACSTHAQRGRPAIRSDVRWPGDHVKVLWPDVHGRPHIVRLSFDNGRTDSIAPVHSELLCELGPLSLMGLAGRRLDRLHALWVPRPARALPTTV